MRQDIPIAETFDTATMYNIQVEVLSAPTKAGLCKVRAIDNAGSIPVARHVNRLRPLNDAARKLLGKE